MPRTRTLFLALAVTTVVAALGVLAINSLPKSVTEVTEEGFSQVLLDQVLASKTGRTLLSVSQRCSAQGTPLLTFSAVDGYVPAAEIVGLDPRSAKELEPLHKDSRWLQYRQAGATPGKSVLTDFSAPAQASSKSGPAPAVAYSKTMPQDCNLLKSAFLGYPFKSFEQLEKSTSEGTLKDEAGRVWQVRKNGTSLIARHTHDSARVFELFKEVEKAAEIAGLSPKNRSILLLRQAGKGDQVVQTNEYYFQGGAQLVLTVDNRLKHPTPVLSLIWETPQTAP